MKKVKYKIMKHEKLKIMIEAYEAKIIAEKKAQKIRLKAEIKQKKDFTNELHRLMHETIAPVIVPMLEFIASKKFYVEFPEFYKMDDGDSDFYLIAVADGDDEMEAGFDLSITANYETREIEFEMDPPNEKTDVSYPIEKTTPKLVEDVMMHALQWFFVDRFN